MQQKKTMAFIRSYRTYQLNETHASDDMSRPDDEFMKPGYRIIMPRVNQPRRGDLSVEEEESQEKP